MYNRHVSIEEMRKIIKKNSVTYGIVFIIIAVLIAVVFIGTIEDWTEPYDYFSWSIMILPFIVMSIYSFRIPSIIEKKDRALDNPDSRIYRKNQARLKSSRKYIQKISAKHKGIRRILSRKEYRQLMEKYGALGIDEDEAERDFNESKVYISNYSTFSVSRKAFVSTRIKYVALMESIVWVFTGYDNVYSGNLSSTYFRRHHLFIIFENGFASTVPCPEELCSLITEDIVNSGNCVTTGYSDEMFQLYLSAPDKFRYAVKPTGNIQYQPVNLYLKQLPITVYCSQEDFTDLQSRC